MVQVQTLSGLEQVEPFLWISQSVTSTSDEMHTGM